LAELNQLRERADQLALGKNSDDAQLALAYRDYIDALFKLYGRFLASRARE
jgi:hypothetical protein